MSIFDAIKNAIWKHPAATAGPAVAAAPAAAKPSSQAAGGTTSASPASTPAASASGVATSSASKVDIDAVLSNMAAKGGQTLNWRSSIVDLMKLVGLDPSLQNRKQLASELGYTGDSSDSASMNIWLHKQVMAKLEESGGQVPASLRH